MINMIKMEFYKLRRQKIFYIILLFVGVIAVMSSISAMSLNINLNGKTQYVESFFTMLAHTHITLLIRKHEGKAYLHYDQQR